MLVAITHKISRVDSQVLTIPSGGTTISSSFRKSGILKGISYSLNNNTNNVTTVISIVDDQGVTLYSSAALNENTSGYLTPDICLYDATHTLKITSADPGVSGNIATITLLVWR